ncbi:MAG TPA: lasso peptide biosynthesis B2 protein [Candidatus Acidoferrales bacterium]|jgi:hypothetical protein|nr:lasso peptide biosynthesis B2 protein [Candidatus Acidoferrales bacterium]
MSSDSNSVIRRRWLLWRAVWRLAAASAGLRLFSFRRMQRWVGSQPAPEMGQARKSALTEKKYSPEELARALARGSRLVPGSTCLVQALAGQWLLQGEGYAPQLRIGVSKAEGFEAHAWLELDGKVFIGDSDLQRFTPFPPVECP